VRDVNRDYGRAIADRLQELRANAKRIGIRGLSGSTRTREGTILHGTARGTVRMRKAPHTMVVAR
jgi:hypothetical protein